MFRICGRFGLKPGNRLILLKLPLQAGSFLFYSNPADVFCSMIETVTGMPRVFHIFQKSITKLTKRAFFLKTSWSEVSSIS
jgi:hypothetical protein